MDERSIFDTPFEQDDIKSLWETLPATNSFDQSLLDSRHGAIDLKRGHFYPEILRAEWALRTIISSSYSTQEECVHLNHGSNGSIDTLLTLVATRIKDRQPRLLLFDPTYFRTYASAEARGFQVLRVESTPVFAFDVSAFTSAMARYQPDVIYLCSPNNPTGIALPDEDLDKIIMTCPRTTAIILDRTLAQISHFAPTANLLQMYADRELVVLHSFSKYCSLAQYRLGVLLFSSLSFAKAYKPFAPLGVNLEGCIRAISHVHNHGGILPSQEVIERISLSAQVIQPGNVNGFSVTPFVGNYGLIVHPDVVRMRKLHERLTMLGIHLMPGTNLPSPNPCCARFHTACPKEHIETLVDAIQSI